MIFHHPDMVRQKMNESGAAGIPFLFAVNFEMTEGCFVENPAETTEVFYSVNGSGNRPSLPRPLRRGALKVAPLSPEAYRAKFDLVHRGLLRGDSYLANLTIRTPIECDLSLQDIFLLAASPYRLFIPGHFVCFSPERFVRIADGRISTNPMKGTINASVPDAERRILADFKETAEHNTIVDLLRNDLSMVAEQVRVERFRYIDRLRTREREILQVSSEIAGNLPCGYQARLGDLIFRMLPAGSCTGAPKRSTVRIIRQAEGEPRNYYTGVFGLFDGRVFDSAVLIRFIEEDRSGCKFFRSGGGLTAYSDWESEYREVLEKIYLPFVDGQGETR